MAETVKKDEIEKLKNEIEKFKVELEKTRSENTTIKMQLQDAMYQLSQANSLNERYLRIIESITKN